MATRGGFWREYRLVIGGSAVLWTLVLVGAWVGYRHFRPLLTGQLVKLPPKLAKAGVIHGEGVLHKESFLQDRGLGKVTAIAIRRGRPGAASGSRSRAAVAPCSPIPAVGSRSASALSNPGSAGVWTAWSRFPAATGNRSGS